MKTFWCWLGRVRLARLNNLMATANPESCLRVARLGLVEFRIECLSLSLIPSPHRTKIKAIRRLLSECQIISTLGQAPKWLVSLAALECELDSAETSETLPVSVLCCIGAGALTSAWLFGPMDERGWLVPRTRQYQIFSIFY